MALSIRHKRVLRVPGEPVHGVAARHYGWSGYLQPNGVAICDVECGHVDWEELGGCR